MSQKGASVGQANLLLSSSSNLSDIDDKTINDFIESGLEEGYTTELKDHSKDPNFTYDVRQAIAAFANRQGGFLLIGVKDKKNIKLEDSQSPRARIEGVTNIGESRQWVDEVCGKDLMQPIPRYEVNSVSVNTKQVVVVKVPPYVLGPVAVKKNSSGSLEFWQRGNGSNLKMDYMSIAEKFDTPEKSLIVAAIVDLMDEYWDIDKAGKSNLANSFNPVRLASMVVEDRQTYYGMLGGDSETTAHINDLRRAEYTINEIIGLCNNAHIRQGEIGNIDDVQKVLTSVSKQARASAINILVGFMRIFPDIAKPYLDDYFKKVGVKVGEAREAHTSS